MNEGAKSGAATPHCKELGVGLSYYDTRPCQVAQRMLRRLSEQLVDVLFPFALREPINTSFD